MKLEKQLRNKIAKDIAISLLIYALPVVLMFVSFYISGQKPWLTYKKADTVQSSKK